MPRQGRVDFPGAIQHITARGIERRQIFWDDADRKEFLHRFGEACLKTQTRCYAFALIPNHFHLFVETGKVSISKLMHVVLTGYAQYFNRRHHRCGHLIQDRFYSKLCEDDSYFLNAVRYIHLNAWDTGLVRDLDELESHLWCGHRVLMGKKSFAWFDSARVLGMFGNSLAQARASYCEFMFAGMKEGNPDPASSLLYRDDQGCWRTLSGKSGKGKEEQVVTTLNGLRVLYNTSFEECEEKHWFRNRWERLGLGMEKILEIAADKAGIESEALLRRGRLPRQCKARALACKWLVDEMEMSCVDIAKRLSISAVAVGKNAERGRKLVIVMGLDLEENFLKPLEKMSSGGS